MTVMTDETPEGPEPQKGPLYAKFTEKNGWEGEIWHFYIPVAGNKDALAALKAKVAEWNKDGEGDFLLAEEPLTEAEVNALVKHGDEGYMPFHNKLAGRLDVEEVKAWAFEDIYKGSIKEYLHT